MIMIRRFIKMMLLMTLHMGFVFYGMSYETNSMTDDYFEFLKDAVANNRCDLEKAGNTLLCDAARGNAPKITKFLLKNGVDPNKVGTNKYTPLYYALTEKHWNIVALLLRYKANDTVFNHKLRFITPFHQAVFDWNECAVELLLKCSDPNKMDGLGYYPLHYAVEYGLNEIAKKLIGGGAKLNELCPIGGSRLQRMQTALDIAIYNNNPGMAKWLLKCGATSEFDDIRRSIELGHAVYDGCHQTVRILLDLGASPNDDNAGFSYLGAAIRNKKYAVAEVLLQYGANVNLEALWNALVSEDKKMIELILGYASDETISKVYEKDHYGNIPLQNQEIIKMLKNVDTKKYQSTKALSKHKKS